MSSPLPSFRTTGQPAVSALIRRLRPGAPITVEALTDVALDLIPALAGPGLSLALLDADDDDPVLVVEEGERSHRTGLATLADQLGRAGVVPTVAGMDAALRAWVARRPVTDAAAAAEGVAVLDWTGEDQETVAWTVVVRRGREVLAWRPSPAAGPAVVHRARSAAIGRAFTVPVQVRVEGQVAVWSCPAAPALGTAALIDPGRLRRDMSRAGLEMRRAHVVVSPGRPVACADASVARRLAGDTVAALLPWQDLADLRWI